MDLLNHTLRRYVHVAAVDHNGHDITSSLGKGHFRVTVHHTDMDGKVNNPLIHYIDDLASGCAISVECRLCVLCFELGSGLESTRRCTEMSMLISISMLMLMPIIIITIC